MQTKKSHFCKNDSILGRKFAFLNSLHLEFRQKSVKLLLFFLRKTEALRFKGVKYSLLHVAIRRYQHYGGISPRFSRISSG